MNTTVKADPATLIAASELFTAAFQPLKAVEGITCAFTLQAYPVSLLRKCENSLGLNAESGPLMSILLLSWWRNKGDDDKLIDTFQKLLNDIDQDAQSRGTAAPFKYLSYAHSFQDPIASYGSDNMEKLQQVSKKFDPEGLFQKGAIGGFKLAG